MFHLPRPFPLSDPLSSFALLDSNILAPPEDPNDIFGIGDDYNGKYSDVNIISTGTIFTWTRGKNLSPIIIFDITGRFM